MPFRIAAFSLSLLLAFGGCAGPEFKGGSGGSGGTGGDAGGGQGGAAGSGAGRGGTGGSAGGPGGSGGSAASSGSGGSVACSCPSGQYCRAGKCLDCADLATLDFGTPEPVSELDGNPEGEPRFPRVGVGERELFYSALHLWHTPDYETGFGTSLAVSNALPESAPLYFPSSDGAGFNFLFSRGDVGSRQVVLAQWDGAAYGMESGAPDPINVEGADDFNAAFASEVGRYWWMSDREGAATLYTMAEGESSAQRVDLEIGTTDCPAPSDDYTPWVTPDGELMLFRAQPVDATCALLDGAATDLYAARLGPDDGRPIVFIPLIEVNLLGGSSESDPSFSADLCSLYFASDREGGEFRIYRAARQ